MKIVTSGFGVFLYFTCGYICLKSYIWYLRRQLCFSQQDSKERVGRRWRQGRANAPGSSDRARADMVGTPLQTAGAGF